MKNKYIKKTILFFGALILGYQGFAQAPANNDCAGAILVTPAADPGSCVPISVNTMGATQSTPVATCASASSDDDVWYYFVATNDTLVVTTSNYSSGITEVGLSLNSGTCGSLTELTCSLTGMQTYTGLTVGTTYYLKTFTRYTTATGTYDLCISGPGVPPTNDNCAGAITVVPASSSSTCSGLSGNTTFATVSSTSTPTCALGYPEVWYSFTATDTSMTFQASNLGGGSTFVGYAVYSGTCGALTELGCDFSGTLWSKGGLTVGTIYYLAVFAYVPGTFDLCIYPTPPPPVNDECAGAINIVPASNGTSCVGTTGNTTYATASTTPAPTCSFGYPDIWYSFTATDTNMTFQSTNLGGGSTYVGYAIYSGTCGSLTELGCDFNGTSWAKGGLTIGTTYYLAVFAYVPGSFDLCIYPSVPPSNDDCSGAISIVAANSSASCVPTTASTMYATQSTTPIASSCSTSSYDDDIWYSFVATSDSMIAKATNLSGITPGLISMALYSGSCSGTQLYDCYNPAPGDSGKWDSLTVGTAYYLRIFTNGTAQRGTFDVCVYAQFPVGVNNLDLEKSLSLYPNPATSNLTVKFSTGQVNKLVLKLMSVDGKQVYSEQKTGFTGEYNNNISLANLSKGIYMLQITTDNSTVTKKVIVQ